MASLSQGRTAAAQCGLFTYKSVPVIFEPPCIKEIEIVCAKCMHINIFKEPLLKDEEGYEKSILKEVKMFK